MRYFICPIGDGDFVDHDPPLGQLGCPSTQERSILSRYFRQPRGLDLVAVVGLSSVDIVQKAFSSSEIGVCPGTP
jgi:hypothetical protein